MKYPIFCTPIHFIFAAATKSGSKTVPEALLRAIVCLTSRKAKRKTAATAHSKGTRRKQPQLSQAATILPNTIFSIPIYGANKKIFIFAYKY